MKTRKLAMIAALVATALAGTLPAQAGECKACPEGKTSKGSKSIATVNLGEPSTKVRLMSPEGQESVVELQEITTELKGIGEALLDLPHKTGVFVHPAPLPPGAKACPADCKCPHCPFRHLSVHRRSPGGKVLHTRSEKGGDVRIEILVNGKRVWQGKAPQGKKAPRRRVMRRHPGGHPNFHRSRPRNAPRGFHLEKKGGKPRVHTKTFTLDGSEQAIVFEKLKKAEKEARALKTKAAARKKKAAVRKEQAKRRAEARRRLATRRQHEAGPQRNRRLDRLERRISNVQRMLELIQKQLESQKQEGKKRML